MLEQALNHQAKFAFNLVFVFTNPINVLAVIQALTLLVLTVTRKFISAHTCCPHTAVAMETLGVFGKGVHHFPREIVQQIKSATEELLAHQYLVLHISMAVQRGNTAAVSSPCMH